MTLRTPAFCTMVAAALFSISTFAQPAATQPASKGESADVPVRAVVLFSSGVGYFEHFGVVKGNTATELHFKTAQINDILKSLVLQDLDGGKISTITYPSQDPVEKTLRSFQVNINSNPPLADLLNQLRGAKVELTLNADKIAGTVLGVEKKTTLGADRQAVESFKVNLITGSGANIKSIPLDNVSDIQLQDPKLQQELAKALAALAQARDQEKKPVQINFAGKGDRHVLVGYVVETPIWKTSYRLVLSSDAKEKSKLQGWAIVENQTDNDWNNVELSLVSGRPISFIQDLYRPLYMPRPIVTPEHYASLRPQVYDPGMTWRDAGGSKPDEANGEPPPNVENPPTHRSRGAGYGGGGGGGGGGGLFGGGGGGGGAGADDRKPIDVTASIVTEASVAKLGELFQYTVPNVSLARQRSAMIPIVTDDIEVERLSIYNAEVLEKNPLVGARLKNTTKEQKHLLEGPITVFVDSRYAGDARIDNLPPGQERLISYGIDLEVNVIPGEATSESTIRTAKINHGVMTVSRKDVYKHKYAIENKSTKEKTVLIEHPISAGDAVVTPKPIEKTQAIYRFKEKLAANSAKTLEVKEEAMSEQAINLVPTEVLGLDYYVQADEIPENVRKALAHAIELRRGMIAIERKIAAKENDLKRIPADQSRIRENMKVVDKSNDYYNDLLKKLRAQESELETLTADLVKLRGDAEEQRKKFEEYVNGLTL